MVKFAIAFSNPLPIGLVCEVDVIQKGLTLHVEFFILFVGLLKAGLIFVHLWVGLIFGVTF